MLRWPAFVLSILPVFLPRPAQAFGVFDCEDHRPPVAKLFQHEFTEGQALRAVSGVWATSGGTFNSTSTTTAIATIDFCTVPLLDEAPPVTDIGNKFWYRARMLNQRSESNTRVGIVYLYQDSANFYEASFSPTGSVFVREVTNGVGTTVATGTYSGGGQGKWFDAAVEWTADETVILVNGLPVVRGIKQNARPSGRLGLITRQTTAKFDRLLVTSPYGDQEFRESFSAGAPAWDVIHGNWGVVNGVYQNSAVEHASLTLLPVFLRYNDEPDDTKTFTVRARMLNPYGASGNRMGILYNFRDLFGGFVGYNEIVFGPDGIARLNFVQTQLGPGGDTLVHPGPTAPYPGRRGQWFDVTFSGDVQGPYFNVSVDGTPVFVNQVDSLTGPIGLVTHWTPGRFDDVWFNHGESQGPFSLFEPFDVPRDFPGWSAVRGTWDTQGAVLNNRSAGIRDIVQMERWSRSTDYTLSARMLNPYGASGNRVGLMFGFDFVSGDYYEVVFAPTGQAYLNKFIQGQLTQIATATHGALGSNVWFSVEVARRGPFATVKVNGQPVFQNVATAQLDNPLNTGTVGVISHWAPGRFDDLRMEEYFAR
jgi:hypothetical protein